MPADEIFQTEQAHLSQTYDKLQAIRDELEVHLDSLTKEAGEDFNAFREELFLGSADDDQRLEMHIEYEYLNRLMDQYNLNRDVNAERLRRALLLLNRPYFAKIVVQYKVGAPARELYIGQAGMVDENRRHFILDWRSPVAELYYNHENGETSYVADGRTITCNLQLRRQFDIDGKILHAYYDTTVAVQDQLLLEALMRQHSDKMGDITMTIQREQNQVIRHEDVPVLLVEGIAGSGKTSVLLQRIAYLFYTYRDTLNPKDVCLLTPNPVFRAYIDEVLPKLGEENPRLETWDELMASISRMDRKSQSDISVEDLQKLGSAAYACKLEAEDFCDLIVEDEVVVSANQIRRIYGKYCTMPSRHGGFELMVEEALTNLNARIKGRAQDEKVHDAFMALPADEQRRLFGQQVFPDTEEEYVEYATRYLQDRYAPIAHAIEHFDWLRIDRIGCRLAKKTGLSRVEWAYVRLCLTGAYDRTTRFVMIDEVQDYSPSELLLLSEYFSRAHFLLLGDRNQAINKNSARFDEIYEVFEAARGQVSTCSLMTSYRSTPQITELFASLLDDDVSILMKSVQRDDLCPVVQVCEDEQAYQDALLHWVQDACAQAGVGQVNVAQEKESPCGADQANAGQVCSGQVGTKAIIAASKHHAKQIYTLLMQHNMPVQLMESSGDMAFDGVNIVTLKLAKGLEFDRILIPDADEATYPQNVLSKNCLYTAISRATKSITVLCKQTVTPLLAKWCAAHPK